MPLDNKPILGQDLLVSMKGAGDSAAAVIAAGTSCSFDPTVQEIEIASKDNPDWSEFVMGRKGWSISSDHIMNDGSYDKLYMAWDSRTPVDVEFKAAAGATGKASQLTFKGQAYVTSLPLSAPDQSVATFSVTFKGTGAVTKTSSATLSAAKE